MWYVCSFYTTRSPSLFYNGNFVIYFLYRGDSSTAPELYLCLYFYVWYVCASYNGFHIDMFVCLITVFLLLCLFMLYNLIFGSTSPWCFFYISLVHSLFHHCVIVKYVMVLIFLCMLYIWSLQYVFLIHTIFSLVALHLGNLVMYISCIWIVMPFSPSLLTYIHNSE